MKAEKVWYSQAVPERLGWPLAAGGLSDLLTWDTALVQGPARVGLASMV